MLIRQNNSRGADNFAGPSVPQQSVYRAVVVLVALVCADLLVGIFKSVLDAINLISEAMGFPSSDGVEARITSKWRSKSVAMATGPPSSILVPRCVSPSNTMSHESDQIMVNEFRGHAPKKSY